MLAVQWSAEALDDLDRIIDFIGERNPAAAERIEDLIEDSVTKLPLNPYLYRVGRVEGTREAVVHPNYIIVYRVEREIIRIVSVLHARQQYP